MKKCFILVLCFQLIACEASAMQSLAAAARWCAQHKKLLTVAATVGAGATTYAWYKKHWPFAKPIDRVALAAVKKEKPEVFALCLAMHPRLGASSPARWLSSDVVKEIDQWMAAETSFTVSYDTCDNNTCFALVDPKSNKVIVQQTLNNRFAPHFVCKVPVRALELQVGIMHDNKFFPVVHKGLLSSEKVGQIEVINLWIRSCNSSIKIIDRAGQLIYER